MICGFEVSLEVKPFNEQSSKDQPFVYNELAITMRNNHLLLLKSPEKLTRLQLHNLQTLTHASNNLYSWFLHIIFKIIDKWRMFHISTTRALPTISSVKSIHGKPRELKWHIVWFWITKSAIISQCSEARRQPVNSSSPFMTLIMSTTLKNGSPAADNNL